VNYEELRDALPLPELMKKVGDGARAKRIAFCPFHDDVNRMSFGIYQNGRRWRWKCFAGCPGSDEADYLKLRFNLTDEGAKRKWEELANQ